MKKQEFRFAFAAACAALILVSARRPSFADEDKPAAAAEPAAPRRTSSLPGLGAQPAAAQEASPAKDAAPAAQAAPAKAPEAAAPAKAEAAPPAKKEPAKELSGCAAKLATVAEGYQKAYEDLEKWMREASDQSAAADDKVQKLQVQIQDNEAAITKLKFESTKESKVRARDLVKENKGLWKELNAAKKEKAELCRSFSRIAAEKVKDFSADIKDRLKEAQSRMQE